jgi:hypothetical protein
VAGAAKIDNRSSSFSCDSALATNIAHRTSSAPDIAWIAPYIDEDRTIEDVGGGPGIYGYLTKWMDIYVEYIPKSSRPQAYQNTTMVRILGGRRLVDNEGNDIPQVPRFSDLKVSW